MSFVRILFSLAIVGILLSVAGFYFILMPPLKSDEKIVIEIESGGFSKAIQRLEEEKIISNKRAFTLLAKFAGYESKIKVGEYEIRKNMWPHQILSVFTSGRSIQRSFTIAEGLNKFDVANILESKGLCTKKDFFDKIQNVQFVESLIGVKAQSLEGYLYPETYSYTKNMKCETIIRTMVKNSLDVIDRFFEKESPRELTHKMITLASIIEKETGVAEERPTISSVFHNRMKIKMRLQTDPTVIYGIAVQTGEMPKNIRRKDLTTPTAYNTYTIFGLPPGPIANPGAAAIEAAIKPASTEYLYFVSMNEGRHYFSKTLKEHNDAVKKYQMDRAARKGKSWRNLKDAPSKN